MIDTSDFVNYLNDWLDKGDAVRGKLIASKKGDIPVNYRTYNKVLYCPMVIDLNVLSEKAFKIKDPSNWYKNERQAKTADPYHHVKNSKAGEVKIMVAKKFFPSSLVLDIDAFVNIAEEDKLVDLGLERKLIKEAKKIQPVLLDSGLMITTRDYSIIKS